MKTSLLTMTLFCGLIFSACEKDDPKPTVVKGIYYLNNQSPYPLFIDAKKNGVQIAMTRDSIIDSTMSHFCTFINTEGGTVYPSDVFSEFKVVAHLPGGDSVLYEGVNNSAWEFRDLTDYDREYALTIH